MFAEHVPCSLSENSPTEQKSVNTLALHYIGVCYKVRGPSNLQPSWLPLWFSCVWKPIWKFSLFQHTGYDIFKVGSHMTLFVLYIVVCLGLYLCLIYISFIIWVWAFEDKINYSSFSYYRTLPIVSAQLILVGLNCVSNWKWMWIFFTVQFLYTSASWKIFDKSSLYLL